MPDIQELLPNHPDAERAVIGALLASQEAIQAVVPVLGATGAMFYDPTLQILYEAIVTLDAQGQAADPLVLKTYLINKPSSIPGLNSLEIVGGEAGLADALGYGANPAQAEAYAGLVQAAYIRRRLIRAGGEIARIAYANGDFPVEELLSRAENLVYQVRAGQQAGVSASRDVAGRFWAQLEGQLANPDQVPGLRTGIANLDAILGYLDRGRLITLAGRPGFGKTSTALFIAHRLAVKQGEPVLFFSYEMDDVELMRQLVAVETGINSEKLKYASRLAADEIERVHAAIAAVTRAPLFFGQSGDPMQVRALSKRINALALAELGKPLALVIVDYLQLVAPIPGSKATTRDREIGEISRTFKLLAKDELHCLVMMLAQLNREVERRADHRPLLADLRESGNIEQDSDVVVFTFCPVAYMDDASRRRALSGFQAPFEPYDLIVAKWRAGRTGVARCAWDKTTGRIISLAKEEAA